MFGMYTMNTRMRNQQGRVAIAGRKCVRPLLTNSQGWAVPTERLPPEQRVYQ